jgi:hypothetical protein
LVVFSKSKLFFYKFALGLAGACREVFAQVRFARRKNSTTDEAVVL